MALCLSPFIKAGATFAVFQSIGVCPVWKDFVNIRLSIGAVCSWSSSRTRELILSGRVAL